MHDLACHCIGALLVGGGCGGVVQRRGGEGSISTSGHSAIRSRARAELGGSATASGRMTFPVIGSLCFL